LNTTNQTLLQKQPTTWENELRTALKSSSALSHYLDRKLPESRLFIPVAIAEKIKSQGEDSSWWKQFVPTTTEYDEAAQQGGLLDPIGDMARKVSGRLIHRYPSRALYLPLSQCAVNCRFCFRRNNLDKGAEVFFEDEKTFDYLKAHQEINEIIFSGGDPLILTTERLATELKKLSEIDHIKMVRFHTRVPTILPSRIDNGLIQLLRKESDRFLFTVVIHINHSDELYLESLTTIRELHNAGVNLLSQSVLLKGINDCEKTLTDLFLKLNQIRVRPYYLHHPDRVKGGMHFSLSVEEGREIYRRLRKQLSGWMLPHYVIDSPEGSGKRSIFDVDK